MRLRLLAATAAVCAGALGLAACGDDAADTAADDAAVETADEAMADEATDVAAAEPAPAPEAAPAAPPAPPPAMLAIDTVGGGATIDVTLPDAIDPETGEVDRRFTGYGDNVSPAIEWTAVDGAQAYVVVLQDPVVMANDTTFMVLHWAAYNIPGTSLPEGVPAGAEIPGGGAQIGNLMGNTGYSGMQPPANRPAHQYTFQVFALDTPLSLEAGANFDALLTAMDGHVIGSGSEVTPFSPPADAQIMQGVSLPDDHPLLAD
jgi:Raf kinase inhibitor-like YbhB/YbcL family protein